MSQEQTTTTSQNISNIATLFTTINDSITLFKMQLNSLQQQLKNLEKSVNKELKAVKKVSEKADKPKRVLSEEQKVKMKAGREAAKAHKAVGVSLVEEDE